MILNSFKGARARLWLIWWAWRAANHLNLDI